MNWKLFGKLWLGIGLAALGIAAFGLILWGMYGLMGEFTVFGAVGLVLLVLTVGISWGRDES